MRFILLVISLIVLKTSFATTYYFSDISGKDSYTSTQAQNSNTPWKSLNKLNSIFNILSPGDSILFKKGETFYGSITVLKSGSSSNPIVFGAYGSGPKPVISGLSTITGWARLGKGLYEKTLSTAPSGSLNMVIFNGEVQPIGRFPKAGLGDASYLFIKSHTITKSGNKITSHTIKSDKIGTLPNFVGGELVQRTMQWVFDRANITSQSPTTITATPQVSPDHPSFTYEPQDGHGFFFQNHINTLQSLGDWCYNQSTKKITMYFGDRDPDNYIIQASTVNKLITIESKNYITFSDIDFRGANENALSLNSTSYIKADNCNFYFSGINAIDINKTYSSFTNHTIITNCHFNNTLNNSINAVESTYWTIANNHIENTGLIQGMGISGDGQYIGIFKAGANSLLEYNHIENVGYNGIWYTGNNTVVRYNHVHHYCLVKSDGGGIYTYGATGTNRLVHKNIVHDGIGDRYGLGDGQYNPYQGRVYGIYNDDYTTGVTVTDNTCFNNSHAGLWIGSNGEITATGNTFFNNKVAQVKGVDNSRMLSNINISNNILFAKEKGSLVLSLNVKNKSLKEISSDNNYYCRPMWEPDEINGVQGYSHVPFSWDTYHDGGAVEINDRFYSVKKWKEFSKADNNSKKTPVAVATPEDIRFEYNVGRDNKTITLGATYIDVRNNAVNSVTLAPYTSIILLKSKSNIKNNQTINFTTPATKTYGDAPFALSSAATSDLPVSFRVVSGPATLSGSTVTLTGTGTVTIEASQPGNANYNAAPLVTQTFTVAKAAQTINFAAPATKTYGDAPFTLNATATSGLPVSFRVVSGSATLSGGTVTLTGTGTVTIEASQAENANYNAASLVTQTFTVAKAAQTINFSAPATKTYGDAPFTLNATAASGLPVNFRVVSGPATLAGSTVALTGPGTVTIEASQPGNANYNAAAVVTQSFAVNNPSTTSKCSATGSILREQWNRVFGTLVSDIPVGTRPSSTSQISMLETQNTGSWMGARIRGYICPPSSGNYTFYIAGDDQVELWLSTNNDPANKVRIAYHTFYTGFRQWNKYTTQKSAPINLKAGQSYYIEVLHKNGSGGDNVSVKWDLPGGSTETPIPGSRLSPYITNVNSANHATTRMVSDTTGSRKTETKTINNNSISLFDKEGILKEGLHIDAYPNPFTTTATIEVESSLDADDATLAVFDAQGRLAKQLFKGRLENKIQRFSLSSADLSNGVYIIRLITKNKISTKKIIVAK